MVTACRAKNTPKRKWFVNELMDLDRVLNGIICGEG